MSVAPLVLASVDSGAVISEDQRYRYRLWRAWGPGPRHPLMLPSVQALEPWP